VGRDDLCGSRTGGGCHPSAVYNDIPGKQGSQLKN